MLLLFFLRNGDIHLVLKQRKRTTSTAGGICGHSPFHILCAMFQTDTERIKLDTLKLSRCFDPQVHAHTIRRGGI